MKRFFAVLAVALLVVSCGGGGGGAGFSVVGFFINALLGRPYSQQFGVGSGLAPFGWSMTSGQLPIGLNFCPPGGDAGDATKCTITGTPTQAGDYPITLRVADSTAPNPQIATKSVTLHVAAALAITSAALPNGARGTAYSQTITSTGGNAPFNWTHTATLPTGLSFCPATGDAANHSNCTIAGTPTTVAASAFTVTVRDSTTPNAASASQNENVQIEGAALSIQTGSPLPAGVINAAYNTVILAAGGFGPYIWSKSGNFPPDLTFCPAAGDAGNPLHCTISGTPAQPFVYDFQVTLTDSSPTPLNAQQNYSLTIDSPAMSITSPPALPNGVVGVAYTTTNIIATGGYGAMTWDITAGALPPPLDLCTGSPTTTCPVTGTPNLAGTYTATVRVRDSTPVPPLSQKSATKTFSNVIIYTPLAITSTSPLPDATQGVAYNQPLSASGGSGAGTYAWVEVGNALSARGLALNGAGVVVGTPSSSGSANFTARVTDTSVLPGGPQTTTQAFALTVRPPQVTITTSTLPNGVVGSAYSQNVNAVNGQSPYAWTMTGALPDGVAFCTGANGLVCALSGTPTTPNTFNFNIKITDNNALTDQKAYAVTIYTALGITTGDPLPDGAQGLAYSQQLNASGGTLPYAWTPADTGLNGTGLTLSGTGLLSGTPTNSGTVTFTAKVTDSSVLPGGGQQEEKIFHITVAPALTFVTPSPLPGGSQGVAYNAIIAATGGNGGPESWSIIAPGVLPAGLNFCTGSATLNCTITGTPTNVNETQTFTVQVKDKAGANQQTVSKAYTITIAPPVGWQAPVVIRSSVTAGSQYVSGAVDPSGNLGVAYEDAGPLNTGGPWFFTKPSAGSWSAAESIESVTGACRVNNNGNYIRLVFAPDGTPGAAYQDASGCISAGQYTNYTLRKAPLSGCATGPWCNVSHGIGPGTDQGFEIAFDTAKTPASDRDLIIWRRTATPNIKGASCDPSSCSVLNLLDYGGITKDWNWPSAYVEGNATAVNSDVFMAVQHPSDGWLHFAHCQPLGNCGTGATTWVAFDLIAGFEQLTLQQGQTTIARSPNALWIAYQGRGAISGGGSKLRVTRCTIGVVGATPTACDTAGAWSAETIVDNAGAVHTGFMPEARIDTNGNPHITYMMDNGNGTFTGRHAYWNGTTWTPETVTGLTSILAISNVITSDNIIHVFAIRADTNQLVEVTKQL